MFIPPAATRIELKQDERFLMAIPVEQPMPVFPAGIDHGDFAPTTLCADIVVDATGDVGDVRPLPGDSECADPAGTSATLLVQAVIAAARKWSFVAAAICKPASPQDEDCEGADAQVRAVPVRLAYAFTFSREAGKASVRAAARH
ncbi:hypothetical protein [Lysobacter fragariae]